MLNENLIVRLERENNIKIKYKNVFNKIYVNIIKDKFNSTSFVYSTDEELIHRIKCFINQDIIQPFELTVKIDRIEKAFINSYS